eukprot:RCo028302
MPSADNFAVLAAATAVSLLASAYLLVRPRPRKLLIVLFDDNVCKVLHALLYCIDLSEKGWDVKLLLEGAATKFVASGDGAPSVKDSCNMGGCGNAQEKIRTLLAEVRSKGLLLGSCGTATKGTCTSEQIGSCGVRQLGGMREGHASIDLFLREGRELVVF